MAIEDFFSFNFAVVFAFQVFPVPPSKANSIGNFLTNRQNAAIWYMFFSSLKVHKIEIFFGFDFEICIISLLVMSKY